MGRVAGKVALVTGAASGIGAACARILAREGAAVMLADLQDDQGESVAEEIRAAGGKARYARLDVIDEANWIDLMKTIAGTFGGLNIAVNSAGVSVNQRCFPTEVTLDEWRRVNGINLDGTFLGTKHSLALMMKTAPVNGSIINISSILGIVGLQDVGAYNASKGGVRLYTKSVALSCCKDRVNVRVNSIHPGFIHTPMVERSINRFADPAEGRRYHDELQPIGHLGATEDIAFGALYLASDEAKFVTGAELVIDGGYTAR